MADVWVLQHVECESLSAIAESLDRHDLRPVFIRTYANGDIPADPGGAAALIVMGGPMGVYELDRYPHLAAEIRLIQQFVAAGRPVLGVCLGSQLLATALGGEVMKGARKEIGWYAVRLQNQAGSLFEGLPDEFTAFHWHGDIFTLPPGATALASSDITTCQAFRYGADVYGLLFHLEVTATAMAGMVAEFEDELRAAGGSPAAIESEAAQHLPALRSIGASVFDGWAALAAKGRLSRRE